jgi:hypothetical protein
MVSKATQHPPPRHSLSAYFVIGRRNELETMLSISWIKFQEKITNALASPSSILSTIQSLQNVCTIEYMLHM